MSSYSSREYGRGSSPEPPRKRVRADSPSYIDLRSPPPNTMQPRYSSEEEQINTRKSKKPLKAGVDNEIHQISTNDMSLANVSLILPYQQKENELDNIRLREKGHFVSLDNESEKLSSEISCYSSASNKEFKKNFVQGYCKSVREGKYESNSVTVMNSLNANKDRKIFSSETPSEQVLSETSKKSSPENQRQVLKKLANLMGSINEEIDKTCVLDCNNSPDKVWCEELKSLVVQLENTVSKKIVKSSSVTKMDPVISNEVSMSVRQRPSRWDSQNDVASDTPVIKTSGQFSSYSNHIVNESLEPKVLGVGNENNLPRTSKDHPKYFSQVNPSSPTKKEKIVSDSPREWLSSSVYNCVSSNNFQSIASNNTLLQNSDIGNSFNKANLKKNQLQEQYIKFLETLGDGIYNKKKGSEINYSKTSVELSRADEPFELKVCTTPSDCDQEDPELYGTSKKRLPGAQRRRLKKLAKLLGCGYEEIYKMCVIDCSNSGDKDWCEDLKNLVIELENKTKKNIDLSSSLDLHNNFTSDVSPLTKSNEKLSSKTEEGVNEFYKNVTLKNNRPKHVIQVPPQCSTKTDRILNKCSSEVLSQRYYVSSNKVNTVVPNHNVNYRSNTKCTSQSNQLPEQRLLPTDLDQALTEFLKEILEFQKKNRLIKTQGPDAGTCTIKCKDWESYSILQLKISKLERLSSDASIQFNVSTDFTNFETTFGIFDFFGRPINLLQRLENNSELDFSENFQVEVDDTLLIHLSDKDLNSNKKSKLLAEDRCKTKNSDRSNSERINGGGNININNSIKHLDGNKSMIPKSVRNKDSIVMESTIVANAETVPLENYPDDKKQYKRLCGSQKRRLKTLRKIGQCGTNIQPESLTDGANSNSIITVIGTYYEPNKPKQKCIINSTTVESEPTHSETILDYSTGNKKSKHLCGSRKRILKPLRKIEEPVPYIQPAALTVGANSNSVITVIDTYNEKNQPNTKCIMNSETVANEPTNSETIPDNSTIKKKALIDCAISNPVNIVIDTYNEINQQNKKSIINSAIVENEPTNSETIPDNSIVKKKGKHLSGSHKRRLKALRKMEESGANIEQKMEESGANIERKMEEPGANIQPAGLTDGVNSNSVINVIDTNNENNEPNKKCIINSKTVANEPTNSETIPDNSTVIKKALIEGANSNSAINVIDTYNENNQSNKKCIINSTAVENEPTNSETIPDNSKVKKKGKHLSGSQKRRLKALRKMEESGGNIERKLEESDANIQPAALTDSANSTSVITVTGSYNENYQPNKNCIVNSATVVTVATVTVATEITVATQHLQ